MEEKGFFKGVVHFIFSLKFLKQAVIAAILGVVLIFISIFFLNFFTNHGESFSVPDFSGLTIQEATELAEQKGLRANIVDSVWDAPGDRGTIVAQNPPKDFKVKENRRIFFTIKAMTSKMIKMPKLINESFIEAKSLMETYGLKIGNISYRPSKYDNRILEQSINEKPVKPGDAVEYGVRIDIVLGKSRNIDNTIIPDLYAMTKEEAQIKIAEMMLNTGSVIYDETVITVEDSANARVRKQFPGRNIEIKPGNEVDIWLSMLNDSTYSE